MEFLLIFWGIGGVECQVEQLLDDTFITIHFKEKSWNIRKMYSFLIYSLRRSNSKALKDDNQG